MKTISEDGNQYTCLAGESRSKENPEITLEDLFEEMQNTLLKRIKNHEESSQEKVDPKDK